MFDRDEAHERGPEGVRDFGTRLTPSRPTLFGAKQSGQSRIDSSVEQIFEQK